MEIKLIFFVLSIVNNLIFQKSIYTNLNNKKNIDRNDKKCQMLYLNPFIFKMMYSGVIILKC